MSSFRRFSDIIFSGRSRRRGSEWREWNGGTTDSGILVEGEQFCIFDDSELRAIQETELLEYKTKD
jgi:hypothetical protein